MRGPRQANVSKSGIRGRKLGIAIRRKVHRGEALVIQCVREWQRDRGDDVITVIANVRRPWDDRAGDLSDCVLAGAWCRRRRVSRRRTSCGCGSQRWARGRGRALHEIDKDILLGVPANNISPVGPGADGRRAERAVVVIVALIGSLDRGIGLGRKRA